MSTAITPHLAASIPILPPEVPSPAQLTLVQPPIKFDAEFIERRMREHRQWQEFQQRALALGIVREVLDLDPGTARICCRGGVR
jgi:hypothetical protein